MHYESVIRFPVMYVGIDDSGKILVRALLALSVRRDWDCFRLDLSSSVVCSLITYVVSIIELLINGKLNC